MNLKFLFFIFSESLYSVQNIANIRIRLIFGYSNTLVYRLSPRSWVDGTNYIIRFENK